MADYETTNKPADPPAGSDEALLKDSREGLEVCIAAESDQRKLMLDDLRFATLDQWPADLRAARENDLVNGAQPCLTVDHINQYLTQVENDMAANRPAIKPRPVDDFADPATADVIQGWIRHVEDRSSAHIAYQTSGSSAVTIGLGFMRVIPQYISPESDKQELLIKRVPDTFSVYLSEHTMPDGSDAEKGWVFEAYSLEKFKREFPSAKATDADFAGIEGITKWKTEKTVVVCEYFYKDYESMEAVFLADGRSMFRDDYEKLALPRPAITGQRDSQRVTVKWCKHTGCEVLEKRDLKGKYIPIIEEVGKEKIVEGKRVLWGLVRPAIDSLRALNYWMSALTQRMALAPKAPWIAAVGQTKGLEDMWDRANLDNRSTLLYHPIDVNGNVVAKPTRTEPTQMEPAMVQMIAMLANNVKSSLGMYKAAVGDTDSQQSGRAILALKKESDTGTSHFGANQSISIAHCGRILIDLMPHYIDTAQILRIIGEDGEIGSAQIDPEQKESMREIREKNGKIKRIYNLGVGTFDVTVTVGPGYTTSRQEAATVMTELANSAKDPMSASVMRYGAAKNLDFHGSEEVVKMLKSLLPPPALAAISDDSGQEIPPAAIAKLTQMQQAGQAMQAKLQELGQENMELKAGAQVDMAKVNADGEAKKQALGVEAAAQAEKQRLARDQFDFEKNLEIEKANHEIDLAERKAKAEHDRKAGELTFQQKCRSEDMMMQAGDRASAKAESEAASVLPKLEQTFAGMQATLDRMLQVLVNPPDRVVRIGGLQKNTAGEIVGASVATKPMAPTLQ